MDSSSLISEGLTLMLAGMGFVFVFLTLLVFSTQGMSWLVNRFLPEPEPVATAASQAPAAGQALDQSQLTAVIAAAIQQYRARHKK